MKIFIKILYLLPFIFAITVQASTPENVQEGEPSKQANCGTIPYRPSPGQVTPNPVIDSPEVWSFVSEPHLHPMKVTINTNKPGTSSGFIFIAPYTLSSHATIGQTGALILDNKGNPIWFRPLTSPNLMNINFREQVFNKQKVLTFWQGTVATPPTYPNAPASASEADSCYYILDENYQVLKTVKAQNGYTTDLHEFLITPENTALFVSTKLVPMDLTLYGGPQKGFVENFAIQEIDLNTNELLFFWSALENIPLADSYQEVPAANSGSYIWDPYHLNSVGLTDNSKEILLSARNTWTIYKINKANSKIIWHLGGKQSSFKIAQGAEFSLQHDARYLPNDVISLFDDNCCGSGSPNGSPPSHGLLLQLDLEQMTAHSKSSYYHDPSLNVASQGSIQKLENGNRFVGWGQSQYYSEYNKSGNTADNPGVHLLYDAQLPSDNFSYRTYRHQWVGSPDYPPSIAVKSINAQMVVYVSWNGSTKTKAWKVFAGNEKDHLTEVKIAEKTGFETAISSNDHGPYFKVEALNADGNVIGVSKTVKGEELF
jgi:hypothetical protein